MHPDTKHEHKQTIVEVVKHLLEDAKFTDISTHITEYHMYFDDTALLKDAIDHQSPVFKNPPQDLIPISAVCVDQVSIFYEPARNK